MLSRRIPNTQVSESRCDDRRPDRPGAGKRHRAATQDTITQPAECLLRQADRYRPREFGIHESDGAPDEKESRPKHEPPGYQACMMRGEMWPRRQETFPRPDASPPRCAQLMGLALRGCPVVVLGATAERRNLLFRSDLGLPWIRTLGLPRLTR